MGFQLLAGPRKVLVEVSTRVYIKNKSSTRHLSRKDMKSLSIAKLQTLNVLVYPEIISLFDIYTCHIRPLLNSQTIELEQSNACSKLTCFIKEDEKWFLLNNFELFHIAKSPYADFNILRQEVSVRYILEDDFNFDLCFYELIELIVQHNKKLDIKLLYSHLKKILDKQMTQQLFGKNIFAVTKFCELIHITEQTYHARRSGILL